MPEVSRFYGIIIKMFFKPKEHEPAHIHALYEEYMGVFDINNFEMTEGDLPNRAQKMVQEWLPYSLPEPFEGKYKYDSFYPLYTQRLTCTFDIKSNKIPSTLVIPLFSNSFFKFLKLDLIISKLGPIDESFFLLYSIASES